MGDVGGKMRKGEVVEEERGRKEGEEVVGV